MSEMSRIDEKYSASVFLFALVACHAKCVVGFPYFLVTQIDVRSQTSTGLSVYVEPWWSTIHQCF